MRQIYRILTKLDNNSFATFSSLDSYKAFEKLVDGRDENTSMDIHLNIEKESDSGNKLKTVELIGLTCDSFIAETNIRGKYNKLLSNYGFWHKVSNHENYYIYVVNAILPIIDTDASDIDYFSDSKNVMDINDYSFIYSPLLHKTPIFRSALAPRRELLCTEEFVSQYSSIGGTGLGFQLLGNLNFNR